VVFIKKETEEELFNIGTSLGLRPVKGTIGIEIEVEGNQFPKTDLPKGWTYHNDNSLRGQDHAEYLLTVPVEFKQLPKYLGELWSKLKGYGSVIAPSNRTSVHVHLNVTEFHLNRLASFIALYFAFEEILTEWCGEHRVGNLFCLRAKDAPAIVTGIAEFINRNMEIGFHDGYHYSGLAADAIRKHGSVEIRTLRGVNDPKTILEWVGILQRLYEASAGFPDPRTICEDFSSKGPLAYFDEVFGDMAAIIRQAEGVTDDFIRQSLYEGVRMYAQDICYARDWDIFKPVNLRRDPFGRDPKKVKRRMSDFDAFVEEANMQWDAAQAQETVHVAWTTAQILQQAAHQTINTINTNPFAGQIPQSPLEDVHWVGNDEEEA
jgi:hypothetical protein